MQGSNRRIPTVAPPANVPLRITHSGFLRPRLHVKTRPLRSSRTNCPQWRPPMSIIPPSMHQDLKEDSTSRSPGRHAATSTVVNADRPLAEAVEEPQAPVPELLPTPMAR